MPKSPAKTTKKRKTAKRRVSRSRGASGSLSPARQRRVSSNNRRPIAQTSHAYVVENGEPAFVLVPIEDYEELVKADMAKQAMAQIERGDEDFADADAFALELAGQRIARARKAAGLTQKELGKRLGIPQSQISRIERNPDHTTVRTLKRIARALGVNVRALVE